MYLVEHLGTYLSNIKAPILLKSGKVKMTDQLVPGDYVADANGQWQRLTKVKAQAIDPSRKFGTSLSKQNPESRDHSSG